MIITYFFRLNLLPNGKLRHYINHEEYLESLVDDHIKNKMGRLNEPIPDVKKDTITHFVDYEQGKYCMDKVRIVNKIIRALNLYSHIFCYSKSSRPTTKLLCMRWFACKKSI